MIYRAHLWLVAICLLLLGATTVVIVICFPHSIVDDAYIYARYAKNLADHGQLTWNLNEDPVEGYTGVLIPLIYALLFKAGMTFEGMVAVTGSLLFAATGMVLLLQMRRYSDFLLISIMMLYLSMPFLYRHVFSGMDTTLFTFLLLLAFYKFNNSLRAQSGLSPGFSLLLLLLALVRPEGCLYAACISLACLLAQKKNGRTTFNKSALISAAFLILPYGVYFAWRWGYYGYPLPNSFYLKATGGWVQASLLELNAFFLHSSFTIPLLILLGSSILAALTSHQAAHPQKPRRTLKPLVLLALTAGIPTLIVLVVYARSHLLMNFSHRYLVPIYPLLLLVLSEVHGSIQGIRAKKGSSTLIAVAVVAAGLLPLGTTFYRDATSEAQEAASSWALMQSEHIAIGKKLFQIIPRDETLVVIQDAGAIPYYSGLRTIDLGGLNDEGIAHNKYYTQGLNEHVFSTDPGVFVITSYSGTKVDRTLGGGSQEFIDKILLDARFANYTLVEVFKPPEARSAYYEFVYVRDDLVAWYIADAP